MFGLENNTNKGLKIIIVGIGKVGRALVDRLNAEGHEITVIDKSTDKLNALSNLYDILTVHGNGASYGTQMEAGINGSDLFIAVTDSDELNLLCCTIAKRVGNCAAIARVRTPDYSKEVSYLQEKLGLAMIINPDLEAARDMASILALPSTLEVKPFAHGQAEMIDLEINEGSVLDGLVMKELPRKLSVSALITAVKRSEEVFIPSGEFVLKAGDIISVVGERRYSRTFLNDIGIKTRQVKDCLIVGGGKTSFYLANSLISSGIEVKIIERDRERCEELAEMLPKAIIINGDGSDEALLREEGLDYAESFVPLTGIDEENILLTLYANQVSNAKVITKINRIDFNSVLSQLNLGSVVYPRFLTTEAIIAYVRAKSASKEQNIETLYHMHGNAVESIEFKVVGQSAITGTPLAKLKFKDNLLIAFINRNGKIIIPSGNDTIEVGDTVMVVTTHSGFTHLEDALK